MPDEIKLFPQLELAAIFLGHCIDYFLKPKGILSFVLPRSFFNAAQHEKIRNGCVNSCLIEEILDLNDVSPLFKVPCCVLYIRKKIGYTKKQEKFSGKTFVAKFNSRNVSYETALNKLNVTSTTFYLSHLNSYSAWSPNQNIQIFGLTPYFEKFKQGATLVPRSFYFVEIDQEYDGNFDNRQFKIKTNDNIPKQIPWSNFSFSGSIKSSFLFKTALSNNIVPFGLIGSHLIALPCIIINNKIKMVSAKEIENKGDLISLDWFLQCEKTWEKYKTENCKDISNIMWLNYQNKLTNQNLKHQYLIIYTASGLNAVSTIIDRNNFTLPFIVESKLYSYSTDNINEAYYLIAFLNSYIANSIIKPFQSKGLYGERDIHKKILNISFPEYDKDNDYHNKLSVLAKNSCEKVQNFIKDKNFNQYGNNMKPTELGKFRNKIRTVVNNELNEIDIILKIILNI